MERSTGFESFLALLGILHALSMSEEYEVLSLFRFQPAAQPRDRERMERVYAYLMGHFTEPIRLGEVAELAGMTGTAFCRYFRGRTNRSLSRFVAELRGYACRPLAEERLGIAGVGSACGYPTLSNFNRQIREIGGLTPTAYRRRYGVVRSAS